VDHRNEVKPNVIALDKVGYSKHR